MTNMKGQNTVCIQWMGEIRKEFGFGAANRTDPAAGGTEGRH